MTGAACRTDRHSSPPKTRQSPTKIFLALSPSRGSSRLSPKAVHFPTYRTTTIMPGLDRVADNVGGGAPAPHARPGPPRRPRLLPGLGPLTSLNSLVRPGPPPAHGPASLAAPGSLLALTLSLALAFSSAPALRRPADLGNKQMSVQDTLCIQQHCRKLNSLTITPLPWLATTNPAL
jgi:hypothetical protein